MILRYLIYENYFISVHPAQNDPSSNGFDDNFFSNDDDYDPFSEDPLHAAFEDGSEIWEDK